MGRKRWKALAMAAALALGLAGCGKKIAVWNGQTAYYAHLSMVIDETDPYAYVGAVDYVFAGTVVEVVHNVIPDEPTGSEDDLSVYRIQVTMNYKGTLIANEAITCAKHGGLTRDGTMLLVESDRRRDSGLPEVGKSYLFMAYAQSDGSLMLSEFFDSREYTPELEAEYEEYCKHQIPLQRERYVSEFDVMAQDRDCCRGQP